MGPWGPWGGPWVMSYTFPPTLKWKNALSFVDFYDFWGTPKFLPLPGGAEPWPRKRKNLRTPLCFCSLAIFWKPQGSHIGVTSSVRKNRFLPLPGGAEPLSRKWKNLRTPLCFCMFWQSCDFLEASRIPHRRHFFCSGEHTPCLDEAPSLGRAGERKPPNALMCLQSRRFLFIEASVILRLPHAWPAARGCPTPGRGWDRCHSAIRCLLDFYKIFTWLLWVFLLDFYYISYSFLWDFYRFLLVLIGFLLDVY